MRVARWTSLNPEEHGESQRGEEENVAPERAASCSQTTERPSKTVGSFSASLPGARILNSPLSGLFRQAGADINDTFNPRSPDPAPSERAGRRCGGKASESRSSFFCSGAFRCASSNNSLLLLHRCVALSNQ